MTPNTTPARPVPPSLAELTARFLGSRAGADAGPEPEVEPHEVAGGFRASAKQTWDDAVAVFRLLGVEPESVPCPPEWAAFAGLDATAVPLAAGLFPQRVRDVVSLLGTDGPTAVRPAAQVPGFAGLRGWVRKTLRSRSAAALLVASGVAAGLGDWDDAAAALAAAEPLCTGEWRAVWENQRAAVLWLRGEGEEITVAGPVAAFNRGVARLFAGRPAEAEFAAAGAGLPETSGWSHLARLYQTVARGRG